MLGLTLREEFQSRRLKGTAIDLANTKGDGATQIDAQAFLEITYPTHDLLKGIEAIGPDQGRPVVVIGERGLGKSHLMAVLYHAIKDVDATRAWLTAWADRLKDDSIGKIALRDNMTVIAESLHRQDYKFLWDLLFDRHPEGKFIEGKWEGMGADKTGVPPYKLIIEMLERQPVVLLLDEFQTWYDSLTSTKKTPQRQWAFNFIQILSEIAQQRPDLLVLVISVRNGDSEAYRQVHRVNPVAIDFKAGGNAERTQRDRRQMLLHRLFGNRRQIADSDIEHLVEAHLAEYLRLLQVAPAEHLRKRREFIEAWPYAPHLLRLLEEQVLIATDAQETRDLIRILANLYKSRGKASPILTAADFRLDDDTAGISTLLDSVSNEHHRTLSEKARHNITAVIDATPGHAKELPHLKEIMSALWLRSIAVGNHAGADAATLQADITRSQPVDDNSFNFELNKIIDNSFNIHKQDQRLLFREQENPRARLMASARNDKLFADGSDHKQLARQVCYVIGGSDEVIKDFRVIALPQSWQTDPWPPLDEAERPERWDDRLPILVLPEEPENLPWALGPWLKEHLQKRRNTIRFLLPQAGVSDAFLDRDLLIPARAVMKAKEWSSESPEYKKLHKDFETDLRNKLKQRFDRFAILYQYNHQNPKQSCFSVERLNERGDQIPAAIEQAISRDLFVSEDFTALVCEAASEGASAGKLLHELQEPRPGAGPCIPWLGEIVMKERILRLCARGDIAINLRGQEYLQAQEGEDKEAAWQRLKSKLPFSGRQLDEVILLDPSAVPSTGGTQPPLSPNAPGGHFPDASPLSSGVHDAHADGQVTGQKTGQKTGPGASSNAGMGSGIFAEGTSGSTGPRTALTEAATSPLNLIGKLESWGIGPATAVTDVSLKVSAATGAQLKELLKKLPDGMTFDLSLSREDTDGA